MWKLINIDSIIYSFNISIFIELLNCTSFYINRIIFGIDLFSIFAIVLIITYDNIITINEKTDTIDEKSLKSHKKKKNKIEYICNCVYLRSLAWTFALCITFLKSILCQKKKKQSKYYLLRQICRFCKIFINVNQIDIFWLHLSATNNNYKTKKKILQA